MQLRDFPFTPFSKIIRGDAEPESKLPVAWSWIMLIYLVESFSRDEGLRHYNVGAFQDAVSAFREMGLSPTGESGKIVKAAAKTSFRLAIPGRFVEANWTGREIRPASDIPDFVDSLKLLVSGVRSDSIHRIVIDGLDDIFTSRDLQLKSLSALIFEISRLNTLFRSKDVPAKIVLLCRTDLFERIPGANKNKIRQDHAIELDWYHDPKDPDSSLLLKIANMRAARSLGRSVNLFDDFFSKNMESSDTRTYLLDMTRHTPRDFLQLLSHLQSFYKEGKVTARQISNGSRDYSIKYFLPEIQDELSGYATPDEIALYFDLVSRLRKRDFVLPELLKLSNYSTKSLPDDRVYDISRALFECSAAGHIQHKSGGKTFYTFKYRNRHSAFNENEGIMLHRGLWKALNIT